MENLNKDNNIISKAETKDDKYTNSIMAVKSFYIFKIILSYLNQNKKLDIIKYNKDIQKQLDINI